MSGRVWTMLLLIPYMESMRLKISIDPDAICWKLNLLRCQGSWCLGLCAFSNLKLISCTNQALITKLQTHFCSSWLKAHFTLGLNDLLPVLTVMPAGKAKDAKCEGKEWGIMDGAVHTTELGFPAGSVIVTTSKSSTRSTTTEMFSKQAKDPMCRSFGSAV